MPVRSTGRVRVATQKYDDDDLDEVVADLPNCSPHASFAGDLYSPSPHASFVNSPNASFLGDLPVNNILPVPHPTSATARLGPGDAQGSDGSSPLMAFSDSDPAAAGTPNHSNTLSVRPVNSADKGTNFSKVSFNVQRESHAWEPREPRETASIAVLEEKRQSRPALFENSPPGVPSTTTNSFGLPERPTNSMAMVQEPSTSELRPMHYESFRQHSVNTTGHRFGPNANHMSHRSSGNSTTSQRKKPKSSATRAATKSKTFLIQGAGEYRNSVVQSKGQDRLTPHEALHFLGALSHEYKDEAEVVFTTQMDLDYHEFTVKRPKKQNPDVAPRPFEGDSEHSSHEHETIPATKLDALLTQRVKEVQPEEGDTVCDVCRWLHIPGINPNVMTTLAIFLNLDDSSIARAEHRSASPCVQGFGHYLFVIAHELQINADVDSCSAFTQQQVTIFFVPRFKLIVSIQEDNIDPWDHIRGQLENENSLLRKICEPTLLIYMLLDALMDGVQPILENYGNYLHGLDRLITFQSPQHDHVALSYEIKRHVWEIRRFAWRMRNMIDDLQQDPWDMVPNRTKRLLSSIRRSANSIAEVSAAYLESAQAIETYYESFQTNEMNNTLYLLSMLTVIIIPTQFLTGVFGMNFEHMPELKWKYSYLVFWSFIIAFAIFSTVILWRKGVLKRRLSSFVSHTNVSLDD